MMYFSNFSKVKNQSSDIQPFLTCKTPHHKSYSLDSVCVDEACKEKNRLICILCHYETHKKHKIQPLEIFISKYKQMLQKDTKTNPISLELNIDHCIHLYQQSFQKLNKIMQDFQDIFSKLLLELNEAYSAKLSIINQIMKEENENIKFQSLREAEFNEANKNLLELISKISLGEEDFKLKTQKKAPEEISKTIVSINNLQKFIEKDLEKNYETFKKSLQQSLNKFKGTNEEVNIKVETEKNEKNNNIPTENNINFNINISTTNKLINEESKSSRKIENFKMDYGLRQRESELLIRNYQFNNFLEVLKHDFASMVEKLDSLQSPESEYNTEEHFVNNDNHNNNKRDFIAEFETLMKLPQKDLIYWN